MPARAPSQAQVKKAAGGPKAKAMYDYDVSERGCRCHSVQNPEPDFGLPRNVDRCRLRKM